MPPKRRLEDCHDDTAGHSVKDGSSTKKTKSMLILKVPPEFLSLLHDQVDTLNAPTATSEGNAASDSDVTEEPRKWNRWTAEEVAFITLAYEKFRLARLENDDLILVNTDVYEAFEGHSGLGRNRHSIHLRLLRRNGGRLNNLYQELHGTGRKTEGRPVYQLHISQEELDAYVEDGYVSLEFDATRYKASLKKPVTKINQIKKKRLPKKVSSEPHNNNAKGNQARQVESDAANPSRPQAKLPVPKKASVTITENVTSPALNSPDLENLAENLETQEPQAETSENSHDTGKSRRQAQDPAGTHTTTPLATDSTQTEPNWISDLDTGLSWWSASRDVHYHPTSNLRNDGQMPITFRRVTSDEEQAVLALVELSRSTDRHTPPEEYHAALALVELSRSADRLAVSRMQQATPELDGSSTSMDKYCKMLGLNWD